MPKITDPAKLAELQNQRMERATAIQKYHDEHQATWSSEDDVAWSKLNESYDSVHAELESHQEAIKAEESSAEAAAQRQERLQQLTGHGTRFSASMSNLIRSGGGASELGGGQFQNDRFIGGPLNGMTRADVGMQAFASWMAGGLSSPRAQAACAQLGFNPTVREIEVALLPTGQFIPLRNQVMASPGRFDQILNTMSTTTGSEGGFTIGVTFVPRLEVAMIANSGMMQTAEIIRTATGEEMRWPTVDDTGNSGSQIGENAAVSVTDVVFGQQTWSAYKFTSDLIKVPYELLQDNAVNLDAVIPDLAGLRIGRIINNKATVGNGGGTMNGIITAAPVGKTAAAAAAITFDEVIDLEHSVNRVHRVRGVAGYMFNDTTLKLLRKLKDGDDRYLWQAGANTGAPDTLNTYPFTINDDMASPATTQKTIAFGKLSQYKLRMVATLRFRRLEERFADNDQVGFVAFVRADGDLLNAGDNPVKLLQQA